MTDSNNDIDSGNRIEKVMIDPTTIHQNHYGYPTPSANDETIEKLQNALISKENEQIHQIEGKSSSKRNENGQAAVEHNKTDKVESSSVVTSNPIGESFLN